MFQWKIVVIFPLSGIKQVQWWHIASLYKKKLKVRKVFSLTVVYHMCVLCLCVGNACVWQHS